MKKILFGFFIFISMNSYAVDSDLAEQVRYKEEVLSELKEEIKQIDSEMMRCEKAKKGWVAATVIGGVGVAATGTAAIVQVVNANKKAKAQEAAKEAKKAEQK